ncbi:hypothetical protein J6590_023160 [Homalodisca vitripennis]|nr:hypothetical protein J6590_023160 [Homalodisca vitripennis]
MVVNAPHTAPSPRRAVLRDPHILGEYIGYCNNPCLASSPQIVEYLYNSPQAPCPAPTSVHWRGSSCKNNTDHPLHQGRGHNCICSMTCVPVRCGEANHRTTGTLALRCSMTG